MAPIIFKELPIPVMAFFKLLKLLIIAGIPLSWNMNAPNAVAAGTRKGRINFKADPNLIKSLINSPKNSTAFGSPFAITFKKVSIAFPNPSMIPLKPPSFESTKTLFKASITSPTPRVTAVFAF